MSHDGLIQFDDGPDGPTPAEITAVVRVIERLRRTYPQFEWAGHPLGGGRMVAFWLANLPSRFKSVVMPDAAFSASELDRIIDREGGELLEHFRVARSRAGAEQAWHVPLAFDGHARPDL